MCVIFGVCHSWCVGVVRLVCGVSKLACHSGCDEQCDGVSWLVVAVCDIWCVSVVRLVCGVLKLVCDRWCDEQCVGVS